MYQFLIDYSSQGITRGAMAVDTFFLMGGLLVSHSLLRELKRNNGHLNLFSFYIHRFLRFISRILTYCIPEQYYQYKTPMFLQN